MSASDDKRPSKLRSRKFWVSVVAATFAAVGPLFGVPPAVTRLVAVILGSYVGTEGVVDAARAIRNGMAPKPGG